MHVLGPHVQLEYAGNDAADRVELASDEDAARERIPVVENMQWVGSIPQQKDCWVGHVINKVIESARLRTGSSGHALFRLGSRTTSVISTSLLEAAGGCVLHASHALTDCLSCTIRDQMSGGGNTWNQVST